MEAGLLFSGPTCPLAPTTLGTLWGVPSGGPVAAPSQLPGLLLLLGLPLFFSPHLLSQHLTSLSFFLDGTSEGLAKALPESYEALLSFDQETFPGSLPCTPPATPPPGVAGP